MQYATSKKWKRCPLPQHCSKDHTHAHPSPNPRPCVWCESMFVPGVGSHSKFCSPKCKHESRENDLETHSRIAYLPTPEEIAEECRKIRSGELVIESERSNGPRKRRVARR